MGPSFFVFFKNASDANKKCKSAFALFFDFSLKKSEICTFFLFLLKNNKKSSHFFNFALFLIFEVT